MVRAMALDAVGHIAIAQNDTDRAEAALEGIELSTEVEIGSSLLLPSEKCWGLRRVDEEITSRPRNWQKKALRSAGGHMTRS